MFAADGPQDSRVMDHFPLLLKETAKLSLAVPDRVADARETMAPAFRMALRDRSTSRSGRGRHCHGPSLPRSLWLLAKQTRSHTQGSKRNGVHNLRQSGRG